MLDRQLSLVDQEKRLELLFKAAELQHYRLEDPGVAIEYYCKVLELQHGHQGARLALESFLTDDTHRLTVAEMLTRIYEAEENWNKLIEVYELRVDSADPHTQIILLQDVQLNY